MSPTRRKKPVAVRLVGLGPGDPDLLTVRAADAVQVADVLVGSPERHAPTLALAREDAEVIDVAEDLAGLTKAVVGHAREGRLVVWLFDGDPFVGGGAAATAAALTKAKVPFEIVAGVSAGPGVPAYAGIPLLDQKHGSFSVVDLAVGEPDWEAFIGAVTLVVTGVEGQVEQTAKALVAAGLPGDRPVALTVAGSTTDQETVVSTLAEVGKATAKLPVDLPTVLVVGDTVASRGRLSWFESRPLFGWRVLVPRTREQAGAISELLRAHGAVPVEVPTIAVEPPRTPATLDRAIQGLFSGRYLWCAFTSVNAVKAIRDRFEDYGLDARAFAGVKVAAVGEQTAAALVAWGIRPDLVPAGEQSSEGLVAEWPPYDDVLDPIDRVFLPRADIATETLVAGLKARGWEVDDVTAYRTVRASPPPAPVREAIKSGGFDAVLFTSSSTVRNLVGIAGKPHAKTVVAVIGPATAETATEHGLRVDVQSPKPAVTQLVEALAEYAAERREAGHTSPPGAARARSRPAKR